MEINHVVGIRIKSFKIEYGDLTLQITLVNRIDCLLVSLGVSSTLVRVALADELKRQRTGKRSELVPE